MPGFTNFTETYLSSRGLIMTDEETCVVTVAFIEELRERACAWRLEAERLQAERVDEGVCLHGAIDLLERIVKYAREDRAQTPGFTRLARAVDSAESFLRTLSHNVVKPPLGVMPERVWDELHPNPSPEEQKQRARDLFAASLRYSVAGLDEPWQWHEEYLRRMKG